MGLNVFMMSDFLQAKHRDYAEKITPQYHKMVLYKVSCKHESYELGLIFSRSNEIGMQKKFLW